MAIDEFAESMSLASAPSPSASFWLPPQGSTVAQGVDSVFYYIFWISLFFFALIVVLMVWFVFRYRRRPGHEAQQTATHSIGLELTWTIIPVIIVCTMFYKGFASFMDMAVPPANAYEIEVVGQKWSWNFIYPNGYIDSELHVPVDRDILLTMSSEDVIHSFFIPAFRVKKDVVPGRFTKLWFRATNPGEFLVFCTEYCGTQHSDMTTTCYVHPVGEFEKWLAKASNFLDQMTPAEGGKLLYQRRGCTQCHSVDGISGIGPSFKNLFGKSHLMTDGSTVTVDENYIRESILNPQKLIVAGYEAVMPTYAGRLTDREISAIIAYIKSITEGYSGDESVPEESSAPANEEAVGDKPGANANEGRQTNDE